MIKRLILYIQEGKIKAHKHLRFLIMTIVKNLLCFKIKLTLVFFLTENNNENITYNIFVLLKIKYNESHNLCKKTFTNRKTTPYHRTIQSTDVDTNPPIPTLP